LPLQAVIIAEFQAMMVQLNAVFAQQKALLSSLSGSLPEPHVNAHVVRRLHSVGSGLVPGRSSYWLLSKG